MLKRKLLQEVFDALDENLKPLYKVNPARAGEFLLEVEADTDNAALVRAKAVEKARADKAETDLVEATGRVTELEGQLAAASQNKPDLEKMGNDYKIKETTLKTKHLEDLKKKDEQIAKILVDRAALELAQKISTVPELVVDAIKRRLKVGVNEAGEPVAEVLDANGLATTATIEDLGKEFVANTKYAAIMVGSSASGSGASQQRGGGGATYKGKKFDDLSEAERIAWNTEDKSGFAAASEANRNAKSGL